ncbi:hypothetical protein B0A50_04904 [Salinomyces thailandicus]|uniref:Uncharacterized protein n=1 Tax=Salinomyces thailandicus TaxID=706561 RepID=A0A4U0TZ15_9PEZI|nr:hypothetical protein B0A50_04904 [Salinomyces thailandica]
MPIRKVFERNVNENMQTNSEAGPTPPSEITATPTESKKFTSPSTPDFEAADVEGSEKKGHPPRFSTLYGIAPPPQPRSEPEPDQHQLQPIQRSGIHLSTPIFAGLMLLLFFESTLLFAYTVIGLYNNTPSSLLPFGSPSTQCRCEDTRAPAVNIAPNFMLPQAPATVTVTETETFTVTASWSRGALPEVLGMSTSWSTSSSTSTSTSTSSTTSTTTSSTTSTTSASTPSPTSNPTSLAAFLASALLSDLHTLTTTTSSSPSTSSTSSTTTSPTTSQPSLVTVTEHPTTTKVFSEVQPEQSTVQSTLFLTVNAAGSTLAPAASSEAGS